MGHATLSTCWIRPWRKLVTGFKAVSTGRATQHNRQNPLSLDRRGIKGKGDSNKTLTTVSFPLILDQNQNDSLESSDADLVHPQQDAHNNRQQPGGYSNRC